MPWRTIRRCVLFAFLGLLTSVVVAWGVVVRAQLRPNVGPGSTGPGVMSGVAVVDGVIQRVTRGEGLGYAIEGWTLQDTTKQTYNAEYRRKEARRIEQLGGAAYDDVTWEEGVALIESFNRTPPPRPLVTARLDGVAAERLVLPAHDIADMDTMLSRTDVGWPMLALRSTERADFAAGPPNEHGLPASIDTHEQTWDALVIPWPWPGRPHQWTPDTLALPYMPRPGLALNTAFYGVLWALMLLAPGAIRRRLRIARGCCAACGFSLAGQTRPGCPECGDGRRAAER